MPAAPQDHRPKLILPLAALIAVIPLTLHGYSCGHDFDFHILNWIEAAHQFLHGNLHPTWAYTPAYNAGEPRFTFYPPISWTIGALLGLILPWTWTPIAYTWLALTAAGASLYNFAKTYTTPQAALIAATFYIVNPYMLFTAYERTAYAELLAAVFIPLLLRAILSETVTIPSIAIPIALLWLTNAPAAVMASYTLAILTLIRLATPPSKTQSSTTAIALSSATNPGAPHLDSEMWASRTSATAPAHLQTPTNASPQTRLQITLTTTIATILGLALAAIYILPAAYERRYVHITMAIIPGLHPQDNFLFHHTGTTPDQLLHDQVLHTASILAITLIALTTIALIITYRSTNPGAPSSRRTLPLRWASRESATAPAQLTPRQLLLPLTILTLLITLLLTPLSAAIWQHLPELRFLQFPWRFLAILAPALSLTIALVLTSINLSPTRTIFLILAIASALTSFGYTAFQQPCDAEDTIPARLTLFQTLGSEPTDEYTPITADNDSLNPNNPPYWLAPNPDEAATTKAPANSTPGPAPTPLTLNLATPQTLILNLRDYPTWRITLNGTAITERIPREDGLIAIPIPAGQSTITITSTHLPDQTIAIIISTLALALLILALARKPRSPSADIIKT